MTQCPHTYSSRRGRESDQHPRGAWTQGHGSGQETGQEGDLQHRWPSAGVTRWAAWVQHTDTSQCRAVSVLILVGMLAFYSPVVFLFWFISRMTRRTGFLVSLVQSPGSCPGQFAVNIILLSKGLSFFTVLSGTGANRTFLPEVCLTPSSGSGT